MDILVVEDDPTAREIIKATLETTEHTSTFTGSAEEGIKKVGEKNFDVILLDYHLPKMSGLDFCNTVRNTRSPLHNPKLWIIAHTTSQDIGVIKDILAAGANDYLPKPIHPHLLLLKIITAQFHLARTRALLLRIQELEKMVSN